MSPFAEPLYLHHLTTNGLFCVADATIGLCEPLKLNVAIQGHDAALPILEESGARVGSSSVCAAARARVSSSALQGRMVAEPSDRLLPRTRQRGVHIEKIDALFLYTLKATGSEFGAGIKFAAGAAQQRDLCPASSDRGRKLSWPYPSVVSAPILGVVFHHHRPARGIYW
ncbi:hypothetical protein QA640_06315 [Bradyrhizobium sp. CB82]|uniref:hypothetical protein n=1 Tax=Bradyrhizobium sp. CB82 TaxID=3039159 RepID=UPI0024B226DD|nr:hypothetical protein [Bradyrhizobium sp. CB82]WFU42104.1 hypothetical protein QA640_06315 [Bradyrhizobium sp. CB82]